MKELEQQVLQEFKNNPADYSFYRDVLDEPNVASISPPSANASITGMAYVAYPNGCCTQPKDQPSAALTVADRYVTPFLKRTGYDLSLRGLLKNFPRLDSDHPNISWVENILTDVSEHFKRQDKDMRLIGGYVVTKSTWPIETRSDYFISKGFMAATRECMEVSGWDDIHLYGDDAFILYALLARSAALMADSGEFRGQSPAYERRTKSRKSATSHRENTKQQSAFRHIKGKKGVRVVVPAAQHTSRSTSKTSLEVSKEESAKNYLIERRHLNHKPHH